MKSTLLLLVVLLAGHLANIASGQNASNDPPARIVSAAETSFPEYGPGWTFDSIIRTTRSPRTPISMCRFFDPSLNGSFTPRQTKAYPDSHIERMVIDANFVGSAITLKSWSYPTTGNYFVVTVYLVRIGEVAVGDRGTANIGQEIYIVRAGGQLNYRGHSIEAVDPDFEPFDLNQPYFFFGKKLSDGLYKVNADGALRIVGGRVEESNALKPHASLYSTRTVKAILAEAFSAWESLPLGPPLMKSSASQVTASPLEK